MQSNRLEEVVSHRSANLKIVFFDIEKYSRRRTWIQKAVIDEFTRCLNVALRNTAMHYIDYIQEYSYSFLTDSICIPTGDGAAVAFAFEGQRVCDVHLRLATTMLEAVGAAQEKTHCPDFDRNHWCNCHPIFNLRVGIGEGNTVVYKDINNNYNAAGLQMNMAARVMNFMDGQQIGLTSYAYEQLVEMSDDRYCAAEQFRKLEGVHVKHGQTIDIYQLRNESLSFLNIEIPSTLAMRDVVAQVSEMMKESEFDIPDMNELLKDPRGSIQRLLGVLTAVRQAESVEDRVRSEIKAQFAGIFENH